MVHFSETLNPEQIQKYRTMGYSDSQIQEAYNEVEQESGNGSVLQQSYNEAVKRQQQDARYKQSNTLVTGGNYQQDLVRWQLELDSILERVEHMLRGDKPEFINGSIIFVPPKHLSEMIFTDFGVGEIMRILSMYLNRNTILSNYDEKTINWKVFDFGKEISDLIYLKYEVMFATPSFDECYERIYNKKKHLMKFEGGKRWAYEEKGKWVDLVQEEMEAVRKEFRTQSLEKRKLYPMIVRELVDTVHSAYLRALHGGERESLREARQVTQTEAIMPSGMGAGQMRERSVLNPMRWMGGKYK